MAIDVIDQENSNALASKSNALRNVNLSASGLGGIACSAGFFMNILR